MIAEAEKFINDNQAKPFFLYLPFIEPHVAMHPPQESVEKFPKDWDDQVYRGEAGYLPHPRPHAGYAAMISDLDGYVGRVLAQLDQLRLSEKTLVIFTSDNGTTHEGPKTTRFHVGGADAAFFNSTAGLKGFKGSVYEGGLRVPMIARLPGIIPANTLSNQPSYFADWFPTLCDGVGIEGPEVVDGESIWPQLTGMPTEARENPMVWVFPEYGGQVAVRIGDMKAVKRDLKKRNVGDWEVYDLSVDPFEQNNLSKTRPDIIVAATEILRRETDENSVFPVPLDSL